VIRIAIVDDHQIVIDGLKPLLKSRKNIKVVAEATNAAAMLELLKTHPVDVLLIDLMMPGMTGFELAMELRKDATTKIKILALSMSEDGALITNMIEDAKVDGYIPKVAGKKELLEAIELLARGEKYFSKQITEQYESYKLIQTEHEKFNLTARELEIIGCIVQHLSNKEIAAKLFISGRTVETHRKNIYRKTNTKGEAALIKFVKQYKLSQ